MAEWVELRDGEGKLQGKWDPAAGVLEIQRRGVKTRYWLGGVAQSRYRSPGFEPIAATSVWLKA